MAGVGRLAVAVTIALFAGLVVIDGDTVRQTYRLLGYDAPETRFGKCATERELGRQATRRLPDKGEPVMLEIVGDLAALIIAEPSANAVTASVLAGSRT